MGSLPTCAIRSSAHCWTKGPGVAPPATLLITKSSSDDAHSRQKSLNRFGARALQTPALVIEQRFRTAQSGFLPRHGSPHEATRPARLCFPRKAGASPNNTGVSAMRSTVIGLAAAAAIITAGSTLSASACPYSRWLLAGRALALPWTLTLARPGGDGASRSAQEHGSPG